MKGFPATRGPICYSCDQQTTTSDCRQIKVCGRDEICYIEEIVLASDTIFHTSCMSKTVGIIKLVIVGLPTDNRRIVIGLPTDYQLHDLNFLLFLNVFISTSFFLLLETLSAIAN
jgi:hypothetical protein